MALPKIVEIARVNTVSDFTYTDATRTLNITAVDGTTEYDAIIPEATGLIPGLVGTGVQTFAGDKTFAGNVKVEGSLQVTNIDQITLTELQLVDNNILLNSEVTTGVPPVVDSGIHVSRGDEDDAVFYFSEADDQWYFGIGANVAPIGTASLSAVVQDFTGDGVSTTFDTNFTFASVGAADLSVNADGVELQLGTHYTLSDNAGSVTVTTVGWAVDNGWAVQVKFVTG